VAKTRFFIRNLPDLGGVKRWDLVAWTGRGFCYRLAHAESDTVHTEADLTLDYVRGLWRDCRADWAEDTAGGAGCVQEIRAA
jgi:hypothetical protein